MQLFSKALILPLLLVAACAPGEEARPPGGKTAALAAPGVSRQETLEARMQGFLAAVRAGDSTAFLGSFSSERPWRYVLNADVATPDTVHSSRTVAEVSPARLRHDLATGGEYHSYFLDAGNRGLGSIGFYAEQGAEWRREGSRFIPWQDGEPANPSVWVAWRQEGGRWVIDEIAEWYH